MAVTTSKIDNDPTATTESDLRTIKIGFVQDIEGLASSSKWAGPFPS
jgi:hypothetical protein